MTTVRRRTAIGNCVLVVHNAVYKQILEETPNFLTFDGRVILPAGVNLYAPSAASFKTRFDISRRTVEILQLAYEVAAVISKSESGHASKQSPTKSQHFRSFTVGVEYSYAAPVPSPPGPSPKLSSPRRGPLTWIVCSHTAPENPIPTPISPRWTAYLNA